VPKPFNEKNLIYLLFFFSGAVGLVYEVLWLKELQLLFGNTAYATATTLSVFFLGLSAGGWYWGKRSPSISNLLKTYGLLEIGIGLTALSYFLLLGAYRSLYSPLFEIFATHTALFVLAKFLLSLTILFLPAFFMGGTLPVLSQYFIRRPLEMGKTGSLLYTINTAGAVLGTFLAGFLLPPFLGYTLSYTAAIVMSTVIGLLAVRVGRAVGSLSPPVEDTSSAREIQVERDTPGILLLYLLSFSSGFLALALQVLWTRMFSQVLQNTVYTFSMILIVFLIALSAGAALASILTRTRLAPVPVLVVLLTLTGIGCSTTPALFHHLTNGLERLVFHEPESWALYLLALFGATSSTIFVPGLLLGSIFPYLLKLAEGMKGKPGPVMGRILSINTLGAILGALCAGFLMLGHLGLWNSLKVIYQLYLLLVFLTAILAGTGVKRHLAWAVGGLALLLHFFTPGDRYPLVYLGTEGKQKLVAVFEGSHSITSVVKVKNPGEEDYLSLVLNNKYILGGTKPAFVANQRALTIVPLNLHPNARSLFYLGMGTGITADTALHYGVDKVAVSELVPEVVLAARVYLADHVGRLFSDPRASVVIEDGRNYLLGKQERYDLIIGDLFLPWKIGIGNLYTVEHFQTAKSKLKEDGLFVQWLALYQLSRQEFCTIVNTMLQVFDSITFWRNSFLTDRPTMALIGHTGPSPLKPTALTQAFRRLNPQGPAFGEPLILANTLMLYGGNLRQARALFSAFPVNTDDRPAIEFSSPQSYQSRMAGTERALVEEELLQLLDDLSKEAPLDKDPYLLEFGLEARAYVSAGADLVAMSALRRADRAKAKERMLSAIDKLPPEFGEIVKSTAQNW
jgi:spermidine synthase